MTDNKALMRRFYDEVFNKGNMEAVKELASPDIKDHENDEQGVEGVQRAIGMFRTAFPDLHISVEDMIAEGDLVATRCTMRGTHKGEFMGIMATGRKVEVTIMDLVRFANGKAVEHWGLTDQAAMMTQLGAATPG